MLCGNTIYGKMFLATVKFVQFANKASKRLQAMEATANLFEVFILVTAYYSSVSHTLIYFVI